jgi:NADH dehydrogenase
MRIVILGGGFGGVVATRHLERLLGGNRGIEITLVSRDIFFMLTPLLFEALLRGSRAAPLRTAH